MKRDYYDVLGVPRDADIQQIKKAYRKLAREHHPDVNEQRPRVRREVQRGHRGLRGPVRRGEAQALRRLWARRPAARRGGRRRLASTVSPASPTSSRTSSAHSAAGLRREPLRAAARPAGPARGDDLAVEVELTLEEAAFGVEKEITFRAQAACEVCEGVGTTDPSSVKTCPECGGQGRCAPSGAPCWASSCRPALCPRCCGHAAR